MDDVYDKLYEIVINKERLIKLKLINVQQKILECLVFKADNHLRVDIWSETKNLTTITFDLNKSYTDKNLVKQMFEIIEGSYYCNGAFCNSYIVDEDDLMDDLCISCVIKEKYTKTLKDECSICLENNNLKSVTLSCSHTFHKTCLYKTKLNNCASHIHISCPNCRTKLKLKLNMEESTICESDDEEE